MNHVFMTMGTAVSLDTPRDAQGAIDAITSVFDSYDQRFSLYKPGSEISRIARGELALVDSSDAMRTAYARALDWRSDTGGSFTPHRPDGVIDLSGIVKALAMRDAAAVLTAAGNHNWCLNVGGDILISGGTPDGAAWQAGIIDPHDRGSLLATRALSPDRPAMATSGTAERGEHIWITPDSSREFAQVTVVAEDIVTADVLATAIISGGRRTLDDCTDRWPIDVLAVTTGGALLATSGMLPA